MSGFVVPFCELCLHPLAQAKINLYNSNYRKTHALAARSVPELQNVKEMVTAWGVPQVSANVGTPQAVSIF